MQFLNLLLEPIQKQISILDALATEFQSHSDKLTTFKRVSNIYLEIINAVPKDELYYLFVRRKKGSQRINHLSILLRACDIATRIIRRSEKAYEDHVRLLNEYQKQFDDSVKQLFRIKDDIYRELRLNPSAPDDFIKTFFSLVDSSISGGFLRAVVYEQLVSPLLAYCQTHGLHPLAPVIITSVVNSNQAFQKIMAVNNHYSQLFADYSHKLSDALNDFQTVYSSLTSLRTRLVFKI